jgi:endonuclease/exonuclease/phosphatase family metal-dependent hydrolase
MLQPGKMQEIAQEMIRHKIDIMALQEIRWQGTGRIDNPEFTEIYSGSQERTGQLATGFIITRKMKESMLKHETINDRICRLRKKGRYRNITIISVHAPTEEKEDREKEEFYECLEEIYHKIQKYDLVIIMGDFNAKKGKAEHQKKVAGKYTIHYISNENGNLLGQFATRNGLKIKSTTSPQENIHVGTWKIPGSNEDNQIDHVLVSLRHSTPIKDMRSSRGTDCDTDR